MDLMMICLARSDLYSAPTNVVNHIIQSKYRKNNATKSPKRIVAALLLIECVQIEVRSNCILIGWKFHFQFTDSVVVLKMEPTHYPPTGIWEL